MMPIKSSNKFHRLFFIFFFIFSLLIGFLLIRGDQTYPSVVDINLKDEVLPLTTNQLVLTFNRNMDKRSVEENFTIKPDLQGKFSWIGKKMAYSFTKPLQSGQSLSIRLDNAMDEQGVKMEEGYEMTYLTARQYLYFIGSQDNQKNKLIQYDFQNQKTKALSPENILVKDFKIHQNQNLIYLLGRESSEETEKDNLYQLNLENDFIEKIVDGQKEYIFSFNIAPNGNLLLVRKATINQFDETSLIDPGSLWTFNIEEQSWSEFWNKELYGSEFYFSPDSEYLVGRLITGDIIILPVVENPDAVVYLENYAGSYHLSPDGSKLVFVDFEDPFIPHDLLLRKNDGETKVLLERKGQIQFPIFDRTGENIYFLMSVRDDDFEETGLLSINPYHIYRYDLIEEQLIELTQDEKFFEGFFNISSDGKWLTFERYETSDSGLFFESELDENAKGAGIWRIDLDTGKAENLNLSGSKPYLN